MECSLSFSHLYSYWCFCNTKIACSLHFYTILLLTTDGFTATWNGLTPHTWFHLRVKHHHPQKFFFWHLLAYSQAHTVGFFPLVFHAILHASISEPTFSEVVEWIILSVSSSPCSQRAIIIAYYTLCPLHRDAQQCSLISCGSKHQKLFLVNNKSHWLFSMIRKYYFTYKVT